MHQMLVIITFLFMIGLLISWPKSALVNMGIEKDDLVILSAPGYISALFFLENTHASLKMTRDGGKDDNTQTGLH